MMSDIQETEQTKVWDPIVRTLHWSLAAAFFIVFATEDDLMTLHVWTGYLVGLILLLRLLWGFIGTRYARFTNFVTTPRVAYQYAKDALLFRARRYIGHNPAGGLMIVAMIISLFITTLTGIALYGAGEHAGPMASLFAASGKRWEGLFEELHEFFANLSMLLVVIHIGGVIIESMIHRENLVRSMINGLKRAN